MKLLILGDIHGRWNNANAVIHSALKEHPDCTHVIQCGDLADGWDSPRRSARWTPDTDLPIHWLDGNHEDHDKLDAGNLNPRLIFQPRGSVLDIDGFRIMFMGGAHSIDKNWRTPGVSWWPQEDITQEQLDAALSVEGSIHAIVSHDRPNNFSWPPFIEDLKEGRHNRVALERLHDKFKPEWWFHGHHHWGWTNTEHDTKMTACPIIDSGCWTVFDGNEVFTNWTSPLVW